MKYSLDQLDEMHAGLEEAKQRIKFLLDKQRREGKPVSHEGKTALSGCIQAQACYRDHQMLKRALLQALYFLQMHQSKSETEKKVEAS